MAWTRGVIGAKKARQQRAWVKVIRSWKWRTASGDPVMKWRRVPGFAGATYFSEDGQWTILTLKPGQHRLSRKQQPVGEFPTVRLAQKAAAEATDE
jgi:hypothetical protein